MKLSIFLVLCALALVNASVSKTFVDFNFNKIFATNVVPASTGPVKSTAVNYDYLGTTFQGYLYSTNSDNEDYKSGVLLFPDGDGITTFAKGLASIYAQAGYVVFLADLYGAGNQPTSLSAQTDRSNYLQANDTYFRGLLSAAYSVLANQAETDTVRVAAVGYGIGGTAALEAARAGIPVKAAVSFYGDLRRISSSKAGDITASLLFLAGSQDVLTPAAALTDLQTELDTLKVDWQEVVYGGAYGYFSNPNYNDPSVSRVYNKNADARSLKAALSFLRTNLAYTYSH